MAVTKTRVTTEQMAKERFTPSRDEEAELSKFFPKDSLFEVKQYKEYLLKDKPGAQRFEANWRKINVGRREIVLFKGVAVTVDELSHMESVDGAVSHFLEKKRAKKSED